MGNDDAREYRVKGQLLSCPVCGHEKFWRDSARVEQGYGVLRPADREATTLTCEECRHMLWFET